MGNWTRTITRPRVRGNLEKNIQGINDGTAFAPEREKRISYTIKLSFSRISLRNPRQYPYGICTPLRVPSLINHIIVDNSIRNYYGFDIDNFSRGWASMGFVTLIHSSLRMEPIQKTLQIIGRQSILPKRGKTFSSHDPFGAMSYRGLFDSEL